MRHRTEGVLRRLLDEPSGVPASDRQHVQDCPDCRAAVDEMRHDADLVLASLATDDAKDLDIDAAWRRLSAAASAGGIAARPGNRRWSRILRRPSVAALAFAVALGGAGTAAANGWVKIFETRQVAPVSITASDLVTLPDLTAYGDVAFTDEPDVRAVPDAGTAAAATGLDVQRVTDLPRGVTGQPTYQVGGKVAATFTFSAERAARAAAAAGQTLPPPPPGMDGASVRLDAGPGVAQLWKSSSGAPALVVGRAVAPTAFSTGVPFEVLRDYLLTLPGLPPEIAGQLRRFSADGATLPLPVPADQVTTTPADVHGAAATVLASRDGALAAVVWVDDGVVTVVAGSLDADEVLSVARGLTWT